MKSKNHLGGYNLGWLGRLKRMTSLPSRILVYALVLFVGFSLLPQCLTVGDTTWQSLDLLQKRLLAQRFLLARAQLAANDRSIHFGRLKAEVKTNIAQVEELAQQCYPTKAEQLEKIETEIAEFVDLTPDEQQTSRYLMIDRGLSEFIRELQRVSILSSENASARARTLTIETLVLAFLLVIAIVIYARYRAVVQRRLVEYNISLERSMAATNLAMKKQQEAEKRREEMVAIVSHELRTPLTNTKLKLEILQNGMYGALSDKVQQTIQEAYENLDNLIALINDLLCLERLTKHGDSRPEDLSGLNVDRFIAHSLKSVEYLAEEKNITIAYRPADLAVRGNVDQLAQVMINLLSNAIKFSPAGSLVTVNVQPTADRVAIAVADCGPGIPADQLNSVFEKFKRFHPDYPGTGLGLSICKEIVGRHNGEISVTNNPEGGCTFRIELPAAQANGESVPAKSTEAAESGLAAGVQQVVP